ncbi:MAG: zinc ribbon domain-containing protein [Clostridia bacterium]|nr:zinc ribbon domain-containing protein [Clostridia bacterium]
MADYVNGMGQPVASRSTLEKNIRNLESEKEQLALIIGNKVYAYCLSNPGTDVPFSAIQSIFNEMNLRDQHIKIQREKIVQLENEIRRSQGGVQCSCGYVNVVGVRFCEKCGKSIINIVGGVQCSCGHMNSAGSKFCAKCGATMSGNSQSSLADSGNGVCSCGQVNVPGSKFCSKCGNNLV